MISRATPSAQGQPAHGAELADDLERLVALHGADTIAAVIVEPVAGSTGVLVPPQGYLQRLRALCDKHGILLIFDEVITGFGRLGTPFATNYFGVTPDLMTTAKGITNGAIPMGAVFASRKVHDALMTGPGNQIELFHGYTYSAHPVACAAGLATLDIYRSEGLLTRGAELADHWQEAMHSLRGDAERDRHPHHRADGRHRAVVTAGRRGARAYDVMVDCFNSGLVLRITGDTIALLAAADHRAQPDRRDGDDPRQRPQASGVKLAKLLTAAEVIVAMERRLRQKGMRS